METLVFHLVESRHGPHGAFFGKLADGRLWAGSVHGDPDGALHLDFESDIDGYSRQLIWNEYVVDMAWDTYPELDKPVVVAAPCFPRKCREQNAVAQLEIVGDWSGPTYWDVDRIGGRAYRITVSDTD